MRVEVALVNEDVLRPDYAQIGYAKGVPMGGELLQAPAGRAPSTRSRRPAQ